jgi:hypothetical protein
VDRVVWRAIGWSGFLICNDFNVARFRIVRVSFCARHRLRAHVATGLVNCHHITPADTSRTAAVLYRQSPVDARNDVGAAIFGRIAAVPRATIACLTSESRHQPNRRYRRREFVRGAQRVVRAESSVHKSACHGRLPDRSGPQNPDLPFLCWLLLSQPPIGSTRSIGQRDHNLEGTCVSLGPRRTTLHKR